MKELEERLFSAAKLVRPCDIFADIGSDHAYLPIYLLQNSIVKHALITDIKKGPLLNSQKNISKNCLTEKCSFYIGSGAVPIAKEKVDCVSICGMGGETIISIIESSVEFFRSLSQFILQPMTAYDKVKKYLAENRFFVLDEAILREEHLFYHVLSVQYNESCLKEECESYEYALSLVKQRDPIMKEFLLFKNSELKKIFAKQSKSNNSYITAATAERIAFNEKLLKEYETL